MRVGIGYDIHRFQKDRPLLLGGVQIPNEAGLAGHSDADVVLHAIIDALLGAAALGDIGRHFPPDDPAYAGADSCILLERTIELVASTGYQIENIDVTVIAERPRLSQHIPAMVQAIAGCAGIETGHVNVKATTNEGLGAIGSSEGMAAMAIALLAERRDFAAL